MLGKNAPQTRPCILWTTVKEAISPVVPSHGRAFYRERRSFALLRPITDNAAQNALRDLILDAYARFEQEVTAAGEDLVIGWTDMTSIRLAERALAAHRHVSAPVTQNDTGRPEGAALSAEFLTRSMRRALDEETARLESGLTVLASVGSTAPFIGLFGTVWGVYHALLAIGASGSGSLDKVAGPVGEALIMTGVGLAVAIPAVVAYNWLTRSNRVWGARLDAFAFELFAFLSTGQTLTGQSGLLWGLAGFAAFALAPALGLPPRDDDPSPQARYRKLPGGQGMAYATGDRAFSRDGLLHFRGRQDHEVKLSGHRVDLLAVEDQLSRLPGVTEAVVLAHPCPADGWQLEAVLACEDAAPTWPAQMAAWRQALQAWLPAAAVPGQFTACERLPRNANGKIDRKALMAQRQEERARLQAAPAGGRHVDAPADEGSVHLETSVRQADRKSTRLNSSHTDISRMPSSA